MRVLESPARSIPTVEPTVVHVVTDVEALERAAAREFVTQARRAVEERRIFTVVLGSDPTLHGVYRRLAHRATWREPSLDQLVDTTPWDPILESRPTGPAARGGATMSDQVPWDAVHVFFSDERHVGPAHPESAFGAVARNLLARVPLRPENLHRIRGEEASAAQAARDYELHLRRFFAPAGGAGRPGFDFVLLGLDAEGGTAALHAGVGLNGDSSGRGAALVTAPWVARLGSHRITMTPACLSRAACVLFVASGAGRADAVHEVLEGPNRPGACPARLVRPERGEVRWIVDRAAAARLDLRA